MKVLKSGKYFEKWEMECVCTGAGNSSKGCEATLLVEKDDLRYYKGVPGDSWGSRDPAVCFKCPICSAITDLKQTDYPHNYQKLTPWTYDWYRDIEKGEKETQ